MDLGLDIHTTVGVTEAIGATLAIGDQDGDIRVGDTQDTGGQVTDTIITLIIMEEEDQLLITAEETMLLTETTPQTETLVQAEITIVIETILQIEGTITLIDRTDILILEEALLQTEEITIHLALISPTEEAQLKVKTAVMIIQTEDQAPLQPEVTTTAIRQETTLLAQHVHTIVVEAEA